MPPKKQTNADSKPEAEKVESKGNAAKKEAVKQAAPAEAKPVNAAKNQSGAQPQKDTKEAKPAPTNNANEHQKKDKQQPTQKEDKPSQEKAKNVAAPNAQSPAVKHHEPAAAKPKVDLDKPFISKDNKKAFLDLNAKIDGANTELRELNKILDDKRSERKEIQQQEFKFRGEMKRATAKIAHIEEQKKEVNGSTTRLNFSVLGTSSSRYLTTSPVPLHVT